MKCTSAISMFIFLMVFTTESMAQIRITAEEAVKIGLENNFGIQLARNEAEIDRLNNTLGNAGFLPAITLSGNVEDLSESERTRASGSPTQTDELNRTSYAGQIGLDWVIFDGLRMFTNYRILAETEKLGQTLAYSEIENTILEIIRVYFNIVKQEKLLGVLQGSVEVSEERLRIAETKRELGSGSEYELLLARADLNADRAAVIRQEVVLHNASLDLTQLLDLDLDAQIIVDDEIELTNSITLDNISELFSQNNRDIQAARQRASLSQLNIQDIQRERLPVISLNTRYNIRQQETENLIPTINRIDGFYIGLTATVNLFDGFNLNRRVQTARMEHRNNEIRLLEENKTLRASLLSEYKNYSSAAELIRLEQENLSIAEEALDIALAQFRLATITSIELREIQNIFLNTENRLIEAQFEAKVAETELLRLGGTLYRESHN